MNIQKIYAQFNTAQTTLVISGWPSYARGYGRASSSYARGYGRASSSYARGYGRASQKGGLGKNHGMAWYTKEAIEPIAKRYGKRFVVVAEKITSQDHKSRDFPAWPSARLLNPGIDRSLHANGKILVLRVFDDQRKSLYPQILTILRHFPKIQQVFVHSEFGAKGGIIHFALVLPFLLLIRFTGKRITFFSHNVIDSVRMLSGHLDIAADSLVEKVMNLGLKVYYKGVGFVSEQVVVLDQAIEARLSQFVPKDKIIQLPIPVRQKRLPVSQRTAKRKLGIPAHARVLVYFGFVSWYKGADWLITAFDRLTKQGLAKDVYLVIAGGPSHTLGDKGYYARYYERLEAIAKRNSQIVITGFVPEAQIPLYFTAADLVVFPYRGLMGASGSMVHALSYARAIMVSSRMAPTLQNHFAVRALAKARLSQEAIMFTLTQTGLKKVLQTLNEDSLLRRLGVFSRFLQHERGVERLLQREWQLLYTNGALPQRSVLPLGRVFRSMKLPHLTPAWISARKG